MFHVRILAAIILVILVSTNCGCLRKSITDDIIEAGVQVFLDAPEVAYTETQARDIRQVEGAPSNLYFEHYLTTQERAAIEGIEIYRNILKIQMVEGSDQGLVDGLGRKVTRAFAHACRDASYLETQYLTEIRIFATIDEERDNFLIAEISFANRNDRIAVEEYNASRSRN
jgi:hypothetical protein